jgi:pimeloyl-ACP methyl ester carboxylesterase
VPATTRVVKANGISFTCLEEGQGPLVLLVHGFPDTAHSWDAVRPALAAAGFRAVSPFTRGYAPTTLAADGDYRMEALADDVVALVEALGEQSAIVVGHDWGSAAAHGAAIKAPERVRMLVTVAIPHPASVRLTPVLVWRARHFLAFRRRRAADKVRENGFAHLDQLVRRWSPAWNPAPGETEAVKRAFAEPGCLEAALGYYRAAGNSVPRFLRARVEVPAVAFAGASDPAVKPAGFEKARRWYGAGYELVTLPGGHFLHREHPDQFIDELLRRLGQPGGSGQSFAPQAGQASG